MLHPSTYAVSNAEDPEKLLDQVVQDMQNDLIKMRQAAAQVRWKDCQAVCGQWYLTRKPYSLKW